MKSDKHVIGLVLAAGLGTRMKSSRAKVLHEVLSKPMILHVMDTIKDLALDHTYIIVGHQKKKVSKLVSGYQAECMPWLVYGCSVHQVEVLVRPTATHDQSTGHLTGPADAGHPFQRFEQILSTEGGGQLLKTANRQAVNALPCPAITASWKAKSSQALLFR